MGRDINPSYRRMAFDSGPVKSNWLYDDLPKSMKDAYVTGKIAYKTKNVRGRPQYRKRPANYQNKNNHYNNSYKKAKK